MRFTLPFRVIVGVALALAVTEGRAAAQDSLSLARQLYSAAAYEDALQMLNRLRTAPGRPDDVPTIEQYRAFCLLALGRTHDAEEAIASAVAFDPTFLPPEADLSPRLLSVFSEVRKRKLPELITQGYLRAKEAYDRRQYEEALSRFDAVLRVLNEPSVAVVMSESAVSDIKTLAEGFRDLSGALAAPPAPAATQAAVGPVEPLPSVEPPAEPTTQRMTERPVIFGPEDPQVVPPLAVRQFLPPYRQNRTPGSGVLEIVVDETGGVETAVMTASVSEQYDRLAVDAALEWEFRPATLNGVPVKYRKTVQIDIKR